jgi:serine/threonine protein kinase
MQGNETSAASGPGSGRRPDREALPPGTRIGDFEIVRTVGSGGFGKVYLAHDHALDREVAIKEYLPTQLACRGDDLRVMLRSAEHADSYAAGLRSFVNEAKILAHFNHPAVVKVHRFWEANGTAYMVMPFVHGPTLRDVRRSMRTSPTEAWLRGVLDPLLDALTMLHAEGVYHRDIAPDNVLLPGAHEPVLLDFGAARRVLGDRTQTLTAVLKPSYAPIEQYAEATQVRQGPWTDLYALGAVLHYLLYASPPPPSTVRSMHDEMRLLTDRPPPGVSTTFLAAVQWTLAVRPQDRPQSVHQLRKALDGQIVPPAPRVQTLLRDTDGAPLRLPATPDPGAADLMNPGAAWAEELDALAAEADAGAFAAHGSATWDTTIRIASTRPMPRPAKSPAVADWLRAISTKRGAAVVAVASFALVGTAMLAMLRDVQQEPSASTWRAMAQQAGPLDAKAVPLAPAPALQPAHPVQVRSLPPLPADPPPPATERPLKATVSVAARSEQIPLMQTLAANEELVESARRTPVVVLAESVPLMRPATLRTPEKRSGPPATRKVTQPRAPKPIALDPDEACAERSFFARPFCVYRKCQEAQFRKHPQCMDLERRREERMTRTGPH